MTTTKKIKGLVHFVFSIYLVSLLSDVQVPVQSRVLLQKKPDPENAAASARWLVSQNIWGVLDTISSDLGGAPFGNVVSFSDGEPGNGSGIPYFYLTTLDPTARNALKDPRASLTISEHPIGTCGKTDPENPTCAKLTLNGKVCRNRKFICYPYYPREEGEIALILANLECMIFFQLKLADPKKIEFAKRALFSKHPEMKDWPTTHNFQFFKLDIENIFLINWFGGPKPLTVDQYLHPKK
ncbi:uncharacterized protein LOC126583601 isoform X1 [Malus sylvestris]|uniref:uncharacterized protein isoform X1 n=1 Tax=Malus domestica TaxID=3750 RepID=UPI0010AA33E3|nr:protein CREG1-like isoform X1 [Malus domestica]XP_050104008.1 uncharacterized protein LOC126583601 isoform X1 [Malus sylvestris]